MPNSLISMNKLIWNHIILDLTIDFIASKWNELQILIDLFCQFHSQKYRMRIRWINPGICCKWLGLIGILAKWLAVVHYWHTNKALYKFMHHKIRSLSHSNWSAEAIVIAQFSLHTAIAVCSFELLLLWSLILRFVKVLNKPKSEGRFCFCHKRDVLKNTMATYGKMQKCNRMNCRWNVNSLPYIENLRNTTIFIMCKDKGTKTLSDLNPES